ncbi:DUF4197 domain-containing protein [Prolixibacteraceae bacterium Z1-6]|uniref:DUF4197 domain-containing protein n=1 Tax=Draconibacterium aestuarii TaxID=2998507 RepID=A0A9X3J4E5_9BACT|nr:DUF4197 domain-containing protein [Prolixibacteraceae bacterium Z1-6]
MKIKNLFLSTTLVILLAGCAEVMQLSQQYLDTDAPLTQNEIIAGLKEALVTGTNNSANILGATDGYYKDELVKIVLPPEANIIVENAGRIPGGQKLLDDVLLHINRAAEDAVSEAKPIFIKSITNMTISDGIGILKGDNNAATEYLHKTTYDQLFQLYRPKIKASVEKDIAAGISTKESWDSLIGKWNKLSNNAIGQMAGFKPVDTQLEDYLTEKALNGLFLKIAEEEKQIRKDPVARVTGLLKKVFGSLDS